MRIAIVGGSNSVIATGYVGSFIKHLSMLTGESIDLENASTGGTTSLTSVARLSEIKHAPDVIVFEYSLNDTGHLNHRPDGSHFKRLFLELFCCAAAERFPDAKIVPLILAANPFYSMNVANIVYDAELDWFASHGISCVDTRRWFVETFGYPAPAFLYSDDAHFHRGCAVAMIGTLLAERVNAARTQGPALREIGKPIYWPSLGKHLRPKFYAANEIASLAGRASSVAEVKNRHVQTECLRLAAGENLAFRTKGFPIALTMASTNDHRYVALRAAGASISFATRYLDIPEGKFLYSSIPLLILDPAFANGTHDGEHRIFLSTPKSSNAANVVTFDGFDAAAVNQASENQLNLIGVLCMEE
ncbi:SGNH/GDSL hydrolase family protein [Burkholderia gladioli]|uniref:SGNH/GDSL hydrolase family protein n=1 Tax=Burkholderia gladioli TaxID=28095 RepID=UPI001641E83D|nr:SGNH/GDSL hydrolase family protein [Burkholderia gladioli]